MSTETIERVGTLRERMTEAREQRKRSEAENDRVYYEKNCAGLEGAIRKVLGVQSELTFIKRNHRVETEIEGLTFSFHLNEWCYDLVLVHECPHCHGRIDSYVRSLARLGELAEGPLDYPHADGGCVDTGAPEPQTAEARFVQALRDLIYESQERGL